MQFGSHTSYKKNNGGNMERKLYLEGKEYETPNHRYIKRIYVYGYWPGTKWSQSRYSCLVTYNSGETERELLETRFLKKYIKNT